MDRINKSLLEQMRITDFELEKRKALLLLTEYDIQLLRACRSHIDLEIDQIVEDFYAIQTKIPDVAVIIGDSDTLARLKAAQRRYMLDLFNGVYDLEYVNHRLRVGLVHKRIGVEPMFYLSAVGLMKHMVADGIHRWIADEPLCAATLAALDKLILFDITLIFETYIRSLVSEIETSTEKSEQYARELEQKVKERTRQLEELSRIDSLTGLLNVRDLHETLTRALRAAQRRSEPVCVIYLDVDNFKTVNDAQGHHEGDKVLRAVGAAIQKISRLEDRCFRYGGDEFCLVLPNCTEDNARSVYLERLRAALAAGGANVSLSAGVAQAGPANYGDAQELIQLADERMYAAKRAHHAAPPVSDPRGIPDPGEIVF
jgi:diguanylate cyclase (GGDEF)-like protein